MVVDVAEFSRITPNPEYQGWRTEGERVEKAWKAALEVVRSGKVASIVLAEKSAGGKLGMRVLEVDEKGRGFLHQRLTGVDEDAFRVQLKKGQIGRQLAIVQTVPARAPGREMPLAGLIDKIEQYESDPGITKFRYTWDDVDWKAAAPDKRKAVCEFQAERVPQGGWAERWVVRQGESSIGKVIPVTKHPLRPVATSLDTLRKIGR